MKTHNINIDTKYFEPIRDGQIRLLIFDKKAINPEPGDCIEARRGEYSVKAIVEKTYIKTFAEITEKEANKAGFITKEFLKDELIRRFKIDTLDQLLNTIDNYMFFLIKIKFNPTIKRATTTKRTNMSDDKFDKVFKDIKSDLYETTSELYDVWRY